MTTDDETFRGTLRAHNPGQERTTLIVLRRGLGGEGRVWLTFDGAIKTTAVLTDPETGKLIDLLTSAQAARRSSLS